jgi:DNA (cytosine-5)-methyltransferase 1
MVEKTARTIIGSLKKKRIKQKIAVFLDNLPCLVHWLCEQKKRFDVVSLLAPEDLIVDNFAGGGGASTGIFMALGRHPDYAINHDEDAISMHRANHHETFHYCKSVWDVSPVEVAKGRPVGLAWFSPDCRHFSKAKGAAPVRKNVRDLAWVMVHWAQSVRPRVMILENVEEFQTWGPLLNGRPCPERSGVTFRKWVGKLRRLGYTVEWRELKACDFGAPTTRKRLFVVARCDGLPITWPSPTHGPGGLPYRTAADCIDWALPMHSIFDRSRSLAEATLRRIAIGAWRFCVSEEDGGILHHPARIGAPMPGVRNNASQVAAFMAQHNRGAIGHHIRTPISTITSTGSQQQPVCLWLGPKNMDGGVESHRASAFILKYYGTAIGQAISEPLHTVTTKARFALVRVSGSPIIDIGTRMLTPRELYRAQGFPESYVISHGLDEAGGTRMLPGVSQIRMCGNAVSPVLAEALVRANLQHEHHGLSQAA